MILSQDISFLSNLFGLLFKSNQSDLCTLCMCVCVWIFFAQTNLLKHRRDQSVCCNQLILVATSYLKGFFKRVSVSLVNYKH